MVSTGKKGTIVIEQRPGALTPKELQRTLADLQRLKLHPREALPNTTALARAEALYVELSGDARLVLGGAIQALLLALETQDPETVSEARAVLIGLTERFRGS